MMSHQSNLITCLLSLTSAVWALSALLVGADDTLMVLEKPSNVHLLECSEQQACEATLAQVWDVAAAAALVESPVEGVPWIAPFGLTASSRPSGVVVVSYSGSSEFPFSSLVQKSYPLRVTPGDVNLADEEIKVAEIPVDILTSEQSLKEQLNLYRQQWGQNLLVLAASLSPESQRIRRSAPDESSSDSLGPATPTNVYLFRQKGAAADFEMAVWLAVLFGVTVFFICIVILQMNQGDDSIIYKTSAAKMGKRD